MASVTIIGTLRTTAGDDIPLRVDSTAENSVADLTTDTNLTVTAQQVGDYKPGATITHGLVQCPNNASYCFILRQGLVAALIPVAVQGAVDEMPMLATPFTLQPGDRVRVLATTAASRAAALCVYTSAGQSRIFTGTPSGSGTTSLVDSQTGNSIGDSMQGQSIVMASFSSVDGSKIVSGGGGWVLNNSGQLAGGVPATNPIVQQVSMNPVNIPIALNYVAQVRTNA